MGRSFLLLLAAVARLWADRGGVASHYRGAAGDRYFGYQRGGGELGGRLNKFKFERHVGPDDTVVDFGCGGGALLANLVVGRGIGVEPNAVARVEAESRGIECVASAAGLEPEIADVVISNHALEHTLSPFDELRRLREALKPGGRLVLWLPMDDWRTQRRLDVQDPNHHLYAWTPLLLRNLLVEAGFEVRECRVVTHAWPRFTRLFARLPRPLFDLLARLSAVLRRRRQLAAVATRL